MSDASHHTHTTLGQRIDALLGPLETEAHQYREAIELGRQQIGQLQSKVALAEEALAGIEQKMGQILDTLTQEEPLLARAMGRSAALPPAPAPTPAQDPPPPAQPHANDTAPAPDTAAPTPDTPPAASDAAVDLDALAPPAVVPLPTPAEDASAVGEIMQMLSVDPAEYAKVHQGPLADAAAQAEQAAQELGGSLTNNDTPA